MQLCLWTFTAFPFPFVVSNTTATLTTPSKLIHSAGPHYHHSLVLRSHLHLPSPNNNHLAPIRELLLIFFNLSRNVRLIHDPNKRLASISTDPSG